MIWTSKISETNKTKEQLQNKKRKAKDRHKTCSYMYVLSKLKMCAVGHFTLKNHQKSMGHQLNKGDATWPGCRYS